jgi:hypothetical protein
MLAGRICTPCSQYKPGIQALRVECNLEAPFYFEDTLSLKLPGLLRPPPPVDPSAQPPAVEEPVPCDPWLGCALGGQQASG